ncbi:hypothetical protein B0H13DRAFT_1632984, partial [Mycena leptocephala]
HCLDMVRQTIQCTADITPMIARFVEHPPEPDLPFNYQGDVERVCHNFEKVQEWASKRRGIKEFNKAYAILS